MRKYALIPEGECFVAVFAYTGQVPFWRDSEGLVYCTPAKTSTFA